MQNGDKMASKLPYEKPVLRIIELIADEVLSTGCKTAFGDPSGVAGNGCMSGPCQNTIGS